MGDTNLSLVLRHVRQLLGARLDGLTDAELLARFAAGRDESAFAELVRRYGPLVFGACQRILGDALPPEDVFQATFLVLVRKAGSLHGRQPLGNWLYTVASRLSLTALRSAAQRRQREKRAALGHPQAMPPEPTSDLLPILDEELNRLPERYRALLVLCYLQGRTHDEAADTLGWPRGSVSRQMARALDLLRERLRCRGYAGGAVVGTLLAAAPGADAVPLPLFVTTDRAGLWFARAAGAGAAPASPEVLEMARKALHLMAVQKLKIVAALLVAVSLVGGGGTALVRLTLESRAVGIAPEVLPPSAERLAESDALPDARDFRHAGPIHFVAFSRDGQRLVTAGKDQTIRVWEVPSGREARRIDLRSPAGLGPGVAGAKGPRRVPGDVKAGGAPSVAFRVALAPDGKHLAAARGTRVFLWGLPGGELRHTIEVRAARADTTAPDQAVVDLAFADRGRTLLTVLATLDVQSWDVATGTRNPGTKPGVASALAKAAAEPRPPWGWSVALAPGGRYLARERYDLSNQNATLKVLDLETGREPAEVTLAAGGARALTFGPDGRTLAWVEDRQGVHVWNCSSDKEPRCLFPDPPDAAPVSSLALAMNGRWLGVCRGDHSAQVWDSREGKLLRQLNTALLRAEDRQLTPVPMSRPPRIGPVELAFAPDGKTLATSLNGQVVRRYHVAPGP